MTIGNLRALDDDDDDIDLATLDSPRRPDVTSTPYSAAASAAENTFYRCVYEFIGVCACLVCLMRRPLFVHVCARACARVAHAHAHAHARMCVSPQQTA